MGKLTWPEKAYCSTSDELITVAEALDVRRQNDGEYRENKIYNTKEAFDSGFGVVLHPVDSDSPFRVNFFRANKGQEDRYDKIAKSVGLGNISDSKAKYTQTALRVRATIDHLSTELGKHKMAINQMGINSVKVVEKDSPLSAPDIIIQHKSQFHRRETRIFVKDGPRKPHYESQKEVDDWFFTITKIETEIIMNWLKLWPQIYREWLSWKNKRKRDIVKKKKEDEYAKAYDEREIIAGKLKEKERKRRIAADKARKAAADKAKKAAEAKRKEEAKLEKLNDAYSMISQTEIQLKEYGDNIHDEKKKPIEDALAELLTACKAKDLASIDASMGKLNAADKARKAAAKKAKEEEERIKLEEERIKLDEGKKENCKKAYDMIEGKIAAEPEWMSEIAKDSQFSDRLRIYNYLFEKHGVKFIGNLYEVKKRG